MAETIGTIVDEVVDEVADEADENVIPGLFDGVISIDRLVQDFYQTWFSALSLSASWTVDDKSLVTNIIGTYEFCTFKYPGKFIRNCRLLV